MRVPQAVMSLHGKDTDVLGLARHGARAAVAVLVMRDGRVIGKESRLLDHAAGRADEALLASFLSQHYLGTAAPPARIFVAAPPEGAEAIREALERKRGARVELHVPERGRARSLLRSAERNAAHALADLEARGTGAARPFLAAPCSSCSASSGSSGRPYRMVCFDISNLGADQAVAAVVASENGQARKALYRRMRMRRPGPG